MNKIVITAGLLFGLAFTANAQMTPNPNDPNQQQTGVQTPGTPPTFPTDRQDTAKDRQDRNQSDADTQQTGKDTDHHRDRTDRDRLPQSDRTDQDQTDRNRNDRDRQSSDRDRDQQSSDRDQQYPQNTDRDQQNQQRSGRDYDRDRQNGSIGSNAGQQDQDRDRQDRERNDNLDRGMNPDRDHRSDYQSQLQNALQQNPNLSGVQVAYTDSTVELSGSVPTGKDKHQARMMAQDYANGRKVVDHISVTGRGH